MTEVGSGSIVVVDEDITETEDQNLVLLEEVLEENGVGLPRHEYGGD